MSFYFPATDNNKSLEALRNGSLTEAKKVFSSLFVLVHSYEPQVHNLANIKRKERIKDCEKIRTKLKEYDSLNEEYAKGCANRREHSEVEQLSASSQAIKVKIANMLAIIQAAEQKGD